MATEDEHAQTAGDPMLEIDAMRTLAQALSALDAESRSRVLRWALDRFDVSPTMGPTAGPSREPSARAGSQSSSHDDSVAPEFEELADLYALCAPKTDSQKALVVSYWLQEIQGAKGVDSQLVNTELKHLGHGVGNITRAFDRLMGSKPQLAIQTKKSGTTRQARKSFKVTVEGKLKVEQMMRPGSEAPPQ